jgi:hypothetical protein
MHACIIESPSVVRSINRMTKEFGDRRVSGNGCCCLVVFVMECQWFLAASAKMFLLMATCLTSHVRYAPTTFMSFFLLFF